MASTFQEGDFVHGRLEGPAGEVLGELDWSTGSRRAVVRTVNAEPLLFGVGPSPTQEHLHEILFSVWAQNAPEAAAGMFDRVPLPPTYRDCGYIADCDWSAGGTWYRCVDDYACATFAPRTCAQDCQDDCAACTT